MTEIGKFYNHDPKHYRFERTCENFDAEPDANVGDWVVWGVACGILGGAALWGLACLILSVVMR